MPTTVSVVIPTFNRPQATLKAIASALAQSYPPNEIIVVDDASEPPFSQAAGTIGDPRVKVLSLPTNRGASAARQAGIDAATGDVIAFLDSDDQWLPEKLAAQVAQLARSQDPLVAVSCGWLEEGSRSRRRMPIASADPADFASGCWFSPGSTVIVPRAAFEIVGPFDPALKRLEDLDWFLRFALRGGRLEVAPVTGARISIGRRGRSSPVEEASILIMERFRGQLEPRIQKRLAAYLDLECAAAARNDRRYGAMARLLARSFGNHPRLGLPLRRWWQECNI
jgi:glycosyltransferase involved in cell wall biosynthesis